MDTNAYAGLMRGSEAVAARVRKAEAIVFSSIVAGELLYGFRHGGRYEANRDQLEAFLGNPFVTLVPVTLTTADRFGLIAATLRAAGTPIPVNDIWIAAHAMQTGADLISFDAHFDRVPGLAWIHLTGADG